MGVENLLRNLLDTLDHVALLGGRDDANVGDTQAVGELDDLADLRSVLLGQHHANGRVNALGDLTDVGRDPFPLPLTPAMRSA